MKYDVAVIGGGPAGMMAAGRAGEIGARVILLEKNPQLGLKLLVTGGGRCNFTNKIFDPRTLTAKYGKNGKFLFSALTKFGPAEVINFFESRGVKTKVEEKDKVFPASDSAKDILWALLDYLKNSGVKIKTGAEIKSLVRRGQKLEKVILSGGEEIPSERFIIATGGKSYPQTGSTGDAYGWLRGLGHNIIPPRPALTPIILKEKFIRELEGLSLKNIVIEIYQDGKKIDSRAGDAIFTGEGISGPAALDLSRWVSVGKFALKIDFMPLFSPAALDLELQNIFRKSGKKMIKNSLDKILLPRLIPVLLAFTKINPEKQVNVVTGDERRTLAGLIKNFTLEVKSVAGYDKAIITAGGVDLREVDPRIMKSKLIDNLFLAGEILDLDGPTGGYNLQVCWSTGYVAGSSAV